MLCPKCKAQNNNENMFCEVCGVKFEPALICPKCKANNRSDYKFCYICGSALVDTDVSKLQPTNTQSTQTKQQVASSQLGTVNSDTEKNNDNSIADTTTNATSKNNECSELLDRGNAFLANGNMLEALKCFNDYLERSQDGSGLTQNKIGQIYYNLRKSDSQYAKKSFMWFKKSAELNCAYGMVNTGRAYENGVGTDKNIFEALRYYIQAYSVDKDYSKKHLDKYLLNNLCRVSEHGVNLKVAIDYDFEYLVNNTREGVDKGDSHSILRLGYMYLYGLGVEKSLVEARDLFLKINEGPYYPSALNYLGDIYSYGCNSILQDYSKAYSYWKKSARLGCDLALFNVGQAFNNGWGVEQNP